MPKSLFIDSTPEIDLVWRQVHRADDPAITVRLDGPAKAPDIPGLLAGFDTCVVDSTYFDAATLSACTDLRHIVFLGTGAASFIDVKAAADLGIKVSTIKGYGDTTVAEHALGLVLAAARNIAVMHREMRSGGWRVMQGMELKGKTIGLIGLGGIGREMARIAGGIGMNVLAYNRSAVTDAPCRMAAIEEVLAQADVVSLHLGLNDATRHFMDAARIGRMKRGAILVNTARAGVVDEAALIAALASGQVGHYATDVYSQEPPRPDEPLLRLDNVTLTAHAGYNTPEASRTMYRRAIDLAAAG